MDINAPVDVEMSSAWVAGVLTWGIIASGITVALKLLTWLI